MKRHGWALGLGMLVSGAALAQPPADSERYPPAPDLPGVVVSKSQHGRPVGKVVPIGGSEPLPILAEPAQVPKALEKAPEAAPPAPATPTAKPTTTAETIPDGKPTVTLEAKPSAVSCGKSGCLGLGTGKHLDCLSRFQNWLCFRSRARQECYVTPYRYPLQAWFECDPKRGICGPSCASPSMPTSSKHHHVVAGPVPAVIEPTPAPAVIPPPSEKLMPPVKPPSVPMPKSGVMAPLPIPPAPPRLEGELPQGFQRTDSGLGFTPGSSPMAKPTTQTERVSTWRPK